MLNQNLVFLASLSAALLTSGAAMAKIQAADTSTLAMDRVLSPAVQPLYVTSPALQPGEPIPLINTAFGKNLSPPVSWNGPPQGVKSYVLVMEDPDSHGGSPTLHWLVYDIPGAAKGLDKSLRNRGELTSPAGAKQGGNYAGGIGYMGPRPPAGDPPHHYHIEVFALDRVLKIGPGAGLDKVIQAMNDHVLAEGEVEGTFAAPAPPAGTPAAQ